MLKQYLALPHSVHLLCLGSFVNRAGSFVVVFLTIYLQSEMGLGTKFATRAMGLFGLGSIAAALIGGHLADRIGRRTVMLGSFFGGAVILVVFSLVQTAWAIMLLVSIFALLAEMYRPAASAMIADVTTPAQRPHAFALMYVSVNLGFAIAPPIGGLIAAYHFQWLFWGDALTAVICGLIILIAIRETLPSRRSPDDAENAENACQSVNGRTPGSEGAGAAESSELPLRAAAWQVITDTPFVIFSLGTFMIGLVFIQALSTFPLHLKGLGFTTDEYGMVIALNGLLIVGLQLPLTPFLSRFHRGKVMVLGATMMALGFGLISLAATLGQFALTVAIWTLGELTMAPFTFAIVSDLAPLRMRGRYMGVCNMSFAGGIMLGAPIGGEILGRPGLGPTCLWLAACSAALAAAVLFLSIRNRLARKQE
jgi:MFS family permease